MNFSDLNEKQKEYVFNRSKTELLEKIISGELRFNDMLNGDDLQKKIDVAIGKAEKMSTPWFAGEYIVDSVGQEIDSMVRSKIECDLYYSELQCSVEVVFVDNCIGEV